MASSMVQSSGVSSSRPKYRWPWILLAAIILGVTVAVLWIAGIAAQVHQMRDQMRENREFSPLPGTPAPPGTTNPSVVHATNSPSLQNPEANSAADPLAGFREALHGGDAAAGRNIFFNNPNANCAKCHRVGSRGGDLGPALDDIGLRHTREEVLGSMLHPNAHTVKGYETVIVLLKNGGAFSGIVKRDNETQLVLNAPDQGLVTVKKDDVKSRQAGLSPMPEGLGQVLTKQDLADLVEFLAILKGR